MGDARQERRQGWQVGRGRWAAGSVNYDFGGWRRRCGGLLLLLSLFPLSSLSGSLAVLDGRKGSRRLSGAGRLAGWLCPGADADDRQAGRCWRSVSPVVLAVSASLSVPLCSLLLAVVLVLAVSLCLLWQAAGCAGP